MVKYTIVAAKVLISAFYAFKACFPGRASCFVSGGRGLLGAFHMLECYHSVSGPFTAFLRAFPLSMCIYSTFLLSGLFGAFTAFSRAFYAVAVCFRRPVSIYARGAFLPCLFRLPPYISGAGPFHGAGAFCAAGIINARRDRFLYTRAACFPQGLFSCRRSFSGLFCCRRGRLFPACFHSAFGAFSGRRGACFRGRGRGFSIMFPGLFPWPGAAGRINIFSAAGAGKSQKNANEQIFTFRAAHAYAPAYARPRPCTRATPRTPDFSLTHGEGKTGQIYSICTRT